MRGAHGRGIVTVALFAWLLAGHAAAAGPFARSDDTRPKAPEQWQRRERFGLDLAAGGTRLAGNVDHWAIRGSVDLMVRLAPRHELFVDGDATYSAFDGKPAIDKQLGSVMWAWAVYDHLNVYVYSTHGRNRFLELRYRMTNSVGVCFHGLLPEVMDTSLVSLGVTPEHEWWMGERGVPPDIAVRATLRITFAAPFTPYLRVGADVTVAPVVLDMRDVRVLVEAFVELKVTRDVLALQVRVIDEYDSRPRPGVERNDLAIVPSLVVRLGR